MINFLLLPVSVHTYLQQVPEKICSHDIWGMKNAKYIICPSFSVCSKLSEIYTMFSD